MGGNKQQLAVYNGRETSVADACSNNSHRVHYYPMEYLTYGNGSSALITTRPDGKAEYKIVDHLGSTRVVVNDTGRILSIYDYEPFGKPMFLAGSHSRKSFIDREKDGESNLYNTGVRQLDDDDGGGRFTSIDPLWELPEQRALSTYNYCNNNPVRLSDPDGKFWGPLIAGVAAVVSAVIGETQILHAPTHDKEGDARKVENAKTELMVLSLVAGGASAVKDATLVAKGLMKVAANEGANLSTNGVKLGKQLASEAQLGEKGVAIAGKGTKKGVDDVKRLTNTYGGKTEEWSKMSSSSYTAKDGKINATHWYEKNGVKYELKSNVKYPDEFPKRK